MVSEYPASIEKAVEILFKTLDQKDLNEIKNMEENNLWELHIGLGQSIRNSMGLWDGNTELLKLCGDTFMHPDDASAAIIKLLWSKLKYDK